MMLEDVNVRDGDPNQQALILQLHITRVCDVPMLGTQCSCLLVYRGNF